MWRFHHFLQLNLILRMTADRRALERMRSEVSGERGGGEEDRREGVEEGRRVQEGRRETDIPSPTVGNPHSLANVRVCARERGRTKDGKREAPS